MITSADVLLIAPELGKPSAQVKVPTTPSGDQITADAIAMLTPNMAQWAGFFDMACKYLAAHRWALAVRGAFGAAGPVIGEAVGSVSRQYAAFSPLGTDPDFDLTPYGKQFKEMMRKACLVQRIGIVC